MLGYALLFGIFFGVLFLMALIIGSGKGAGGAILNVGLVLIAIAVGTIIAATLLAVIVWLAYAFVEFVLAKILGGSGSYRAHAYLTALQGAGFGAATLPLFFLYFIPCVGTILYPISILIGIYSVYVRYLIVKQVHSLSRNRAMLVILIPILVIVGAFILFYVGLLLLSLIARTAD